MSCLTKTERIAQLNDLARTAMGFASRLVQTAGVCALPEAIQSRIRERVERWENFTPSNDPYGEHDCGCFNEAGHDLMWKIDYYNLDLTAGSEDPADSWQTVRVLTILLAEEY